MSQNWKRRRPAFFQPRVELLEDRAVPAGNITATVINGVLSVRSDDGIHFLQVSGTGKQSVIIRVSDGTTLNGSTDNESFGGISHGFDIEVGGVANTVIIDNVHANDFLTVDATGSFSNAVQILPGTYVGSSTVISTGDGDDFVLIAGANLKGSFALETGAGDDLVDVADTTFGNVITADGGSGNNTLGQIDNRIGGPASTTNFGTVVNNVLPSTGADTATVASDQSTSVDVLANDTPVAGTLVPSTVTIVNTPAHGTATVNADGSITYTNNGSGTSDSFGYTVQNSLGGVSNVGIVTITVTGSSTTTGPTATISSTTNATTNVTPIPYTVNFSEPVTGFAQSDLTVTGGTASDITTVSTSQYTFTVTPSGDGTVTVLIPAGSVVDSAGNGNTVSNTITRTFDSTAPTVTINSLTTNKTTPTITGTVDDSTATVSVTVDGQTATATVNGTTWSATLGTALADGTYTITATATDPAGNVGNATSTNGLIINTVAPTATITSTATSPTAVSPIPVTVTFSENVNGFAASGVTVTNGTITNFASTNASTYTFDVTPNATGTVTVNVAAGVASDAAGNENTAATAFTITFDGTLPTVTLTSTATSPTAASPIPITATFSEAVTGFTSSGVTVTNGTITNFTPVSSTTYTFDVTPNATGTVTVNIAADVAQDGSGNGNPAATPFTITFDGTLPTVTLTSTATSPTKTSPIPVTATFSESVTGFSSSGVSVTNGTISNFTAVNGTTYTFDVTPTADGAVTVNIAADVAHDASGNGNPPATPFDITFDTTAPTVAITSTASNPTGMTPIPVEATFSEPVTGFTSSGITVTNGTVSNFAAVNSSTYTFDVTPTAQGAVTVNIAAGAAQDDAGNASTAATPFSITYDTPPTVSLFSTLADPTTNSPIPVTASFNEAVTGFSISGITVTNGTVSDFSETNSSTYKFDVTPNATGTVTVNVAADAAQDGAGNGNTAATPFTITFNGTLPTVTLTSTATSPTTASPIPVTATFSESVTGFSSSGVTVTNGTVSDFTAVSGTTYTFDVTPSANGAVTVNVASNVATDSSGNGNPPATPLSITFDGTLPTVKIASTAANPTNIVPIPVTATFSEAVTDFTSGDVSITNGTLTNFATSDNTTFTFDVTPTADGAVTVNIPANVAKDSSGNGNIAASPFSITSDTTAPTVTLTSTASSPTTVSPIPMTATFSEPVTGFSSLSISAVNGTVSDFAAVSSTVYTFDVTPTASGTVTVNVNADAAVDAAGNDSKAATPFSITFDSEAPTVTLSTTAANPTNDNPIPVTATFNEDVTGFSSTSITATNGTISHFVAVSASVYTFDVAPLSDGEVTVNVAADAAQDSFGTGSAAATPLSITSDTTPPSVTLNSPSNELTNQSPIPVSADFSEGVTGFSASSITVTNGTVSDFNETNGAVYTFNVIPAANGTVTVSIDADVAQDNAGNGNTAATPLMFTYDTVAPTDTINPLTTNQTLPTLTGTVSEAGAKVAVTVNSQTVDATVTGTNWSATLTTALTDGTYDISTVTSDAAGNTSDNTLTGGLVVDTTPPSVVVASSLSSPTNSEAIPISVTFSEDVTGFDASDVALGNSTLSNFVAVDAKDYTFDVKPMADGTVTVSVPAGAAVDQANNSSTVSNNFSIVSDTTPPTAAIEYTGENPTNATSLPITVKFSENVTGFDATKVTVTNGTLSNFTAVDGETYTFKVAPLVDGNVTISVAGGVATDAAGNANTAAPDETIAYDATPPSGTINPASSGAVTGTASDTGSGVAGVTVSIFNGTDYWDGTGFNSTTEILLPASTTDGYADWSLAISIPGTYAVHAQITDVVGNVTQLNMPAVVVS